MHIPRALRAKFGAKAFQVVLVGYDSNTKGYRCFDPSRNKIIISRDVVFIENTLGDFKSVHHSDVLGDLLATIAAQEGQTNNTAQNAPPLDQLLAHDVHLPPAQEAALPVAPPFNAVIAPEHPQEAAPPEVAIPAAEPTLANQPNQRIHRRQARRPAPPQQPPRRGTRNRQTPSHLENYDLTIYDNADICYVESTEPATDKIDFKTAQAHSLWSKAMTEEFDSLMKMHTWDLVELPPGRRPISSKWTYKVKPTARPTHARLKARLVARGLEQRYGIDFKETFAPVVRWSTLRALIALATTLNWPIQHMDVVTAFLNGLLKEDIYMQQPMGYAAEGKEHLVCKLRRSIYGLKQSPREWYIEVDTHLRSTGWIKSEADPNLYYLKDSDTLTILLLYVDDLLLLGNSTTNISEVKALLSAKYQMKDLGPIARYLGMEFIRMPQGMLLHQAAYNREILKDLDMQDCKPLGTPLPEGFITQSESNTSPVDRTQYYQAVGKLLYLTNTRPDLSHSVGIVARFMAAPQQNHLEAVKHILRYLKGTINYGILYKSNAPLDLHGYTDAAYLDCLEMRRSTGGYLFKLADGPISWSSKRQDTVSDSTTEAEYKALSIGAKEAVYLRRLLLEI